MLREKKFRNFLNKSVSLFKSKSYLSCTISYSMKQIFHSSLFKHIATLLSANSVSQAIALLVYPLITRLYAPENFGLFNLFLSIGGILAIVGTANYHYAIVLPKNERKAFACLSLSFIITAALVVLSVIALIFSSQIALLFDSPDLGKYLFLMPIFVLLTALWNSLNYWFTRYQWYKPIAFYQVGNSLSSSLLKYLFGLSGFLTGGLLFGTLIAQFAAMVGSLWIAWKKGIAKVLTITQQEIKDVAVEYRNFPQFSLPHSLINTLGGSLPILLLAPFFSLAHIGFFGMAMALAFRPINIISSSLNQVFYPITTQKVNDKESILRFFKRYISRTLYILLPLFIGLFTILPWLTEWLLGANWNVTGEYMQLMLPWLLFSALVAPITYLADLFGKQKIALGIEIASVVMRLSGLLIGIMAESFYLAIAFYCLASALVVAGQLIWYSRLVVQYEKTIKV